MNYKKFFRIVSRVFPNWIVFGAMNFIMRLKYGIRVGRGSKVFIDSFFEGHNSVYNNTRIQGSYIGLGTYIASDSRINLTKIGRFCSIGDNVKIGIGQHPSKKFVSTNPAFYSTNFCKDLAFSKNQKFEDHSYVDLEKKYAVQIGNDVWIGSNVVIMDGIKVGDGAIIGAGAIVTKDVLNYSIVGGIPARLIRNRFTEEEIGFLNNFKWWNKSFEWIKNNSKFFEDIEIFIKQNGNK